jgi:enoyl-CoA hydratase
VGDDAGVRTVDEVRRERRGPAYLVTIDRQHRRNAVDGRTADALEAALDAFEADAAARVMVLTGAGGRAFCAGADLTAIDTLTPRLHAPGGPLGVTHRLASKPVIAAIDGWAVAGGLELALWADLRIATPRSRFGCLERRWGVPLIDGGTWRLPRVVGQGRALDLILTGRVVSAEEALAIGLVTSLAADPVAAAVELAAELAAYPQETLLADRESVHQGYGLSESAGLAAESRRGIPTVTIGAQGAARFAAGAGRGGAAAQVGDPAE